MNWQPIKTAPKDGTPILVRCRDMSVTASFINGSQIDANLITIDNEGTLLEQGFYELNHHAIEADGFYYQIHPTHWAPLPPPPDENKPYQPSDYVLYLLAGNKKLIEENKRLKEQLKEGGH